MVGLWLDEMAQIAGMTMVIMDSISAPTHPLHLTADHPTTLYRPPPPHTSPLNSVHPPSSPSPSSPSPSSFIAIRRFPLFMSGDHGAQPSLSSRTQSRIRQRCRRRRPPRQTQSMLRNGKRSEPEMPVPQSCFCSFRLSAMAPMSCPRPVPSYPGGVHPHPVVATIFGPLRRGQA